MNPSRRLFLLAACLSTVLATGCHPSDPQTTVVSKPAEHAAADGKTVTASGVSLTFPDGWRTVDLSQGQLDAAVAALAKGPRGAEMAQAVKVAAGTGMVKMIVFAPGGAKAGFLDNMNLVVQPGVGNATLDQALDASKRQMAALDPKVATSKVSFPAGEFGRLESHLTAPNGKPYVAIGYLQVGGTDLDVVTFSCGADEAAAYDAQAQSIMKTFKRA